MAKKKKPTGGVAIIYARYSSHNQRDVSIEQQIEACRKHAAELGLTITDTYEDRAISGRTDNRPAFQRMMRDAEDGKFQYVLAWKSNRMGRNMMQAMVNESRLMDCGVKVFYAEEDFDDSAAGRFALRSMMNVNQFYSDNLAEDVRRGLMDNASKCMANGRQPLGYKRGEDGKVVVDEPAAAIVREIYTRIASGEMFMDIARDLNRRGIKTQSGSEWNKSSFKVLCRNERYRGIYIYGDTRIEGGIPPIVDDVLWYKVQEVLKVKKSKNRHHCPSDEDYLLTGKLRCGKCGGYMIGMSGRSKTGDVHHYYACQNRRVGHTCDKKNIRRDVVEPAVAQAIKQYCLTDDAIEWITDQTIAYWEDEDRKLQIDSIENDLSAVQSSISNVMKAIEMGVITETTRDRLIELERQQTDLKSKLALAKEEIVHVDGANHTPESLCRLLNFATGRQDLFYEALQIGSRADHWCHKINPTLFREMKKNGRASRNDAERIWYSVANDGYDGGVDSSHYNSTRYHGINLHAFFTKGTVEFRLFNGTTHAGRIKAYVQFCLAMSAWAINCDHDNLHFKSVAGYTQQQKHDLMLRVLTKRLGMRGPEFKTARLHLTSAFLTEAESENTAA